MTYIALIPGVYYNVKQYGAKGDGTTDDTAAIAAALADASANGGGTVFLPSICAVSSSLTIPTNVYLMGGGNGTGIKALAGFSGAQMILCTGNNSTILNMSIIGGPSTTYSSNPSTNGVQITGAANITVQNLLCQYINGWGVNATATSGQANLYLSCVNVRVSQGAQGIHSQGVTGSGNAGSQQFFGCICDHIQNGDGFLFEDVNDIICTSLFSACTAGSGNAVHIKGLCAVVFLNSVDLGSYPGPTSGSTVLVENDGFGSPNLVTIIGGIIEAGAANITVSAGTQILFSGLEIFDGGTYGINLTGGDDIQIRDCIFSANGSAGTTGRYDLQSTTANSVDIAGCRFQTAQGSTAQHTNNAVNVTAGTVIMQGCKFSGSGYTSANIFAGVPTIVRNCAGYNPLGNISVSVPASNANFTAQPTDVTYYVTGGTVTIIKIGGVATGFTSGTFRVQATQTFSITYSVAPSVTGFAD